MKRKNSIYIQNAAASQLLAALFPSLVPDAQMCKLTEHLDNPPLPGREAAPLRFAVRGAATRWRWRHAQPGPGRLRLRSGSAARREPAFPARPLGVPVLGAFLGFLLFEHLT